MTKEMIDQMFEASKLDGTVIVGSDIRELCRVIRKLESVIEDYRTERKASEESACIAIADIVAGAGLSLPERELLRLVEDSEDLVQLVHQWWCYTDDQKRLASKELWDAYDEWCADPWVEE